MRELFDEPTSALYQVAALPRTLDDASASEGAFDPDARVAQVDGLIMSAVAALEGRSEAEMVRRLLRVRDAVGGTAGQSSDDDLSVAQADAMAAVNAYFERVLTGVPSIKAYLDEVAASGAAPAPAA